MVDYCECYQGCTSPGDRWPWRLKFLRWCLIFECLQHGNCLMSSFQRLVHLGDFQMFGKFAHPLKLFFFPDSTVCLSETAEKFWNVVLEKDGEDQLDRSCEKWKSIRVEEQRNILHEISKRKANWIGHILRRNCLLQRVTEGKIKGGIQVTGRRGRRRRKLLDDLKERRWYSHLKEEALDCTIWRARFGRGFGPVVRQTTKWMTVYLEI